MDCQSFLLTGADNDDHHHQYYHCFHPQFYDEREGPVPDDDGHVHCESSSGWENPLQGDEGDEDGGADGSDGTDDHAGHADGTVGAYAEDHAVCGNPCWLRSN